MKARFPLLACCLLAFAAQAQETKVQMWKWTDANGVVHYSDVPAPGAVQVGLSVPQGQPGSAPPVSNTGYGESEGGDDGTRDGASPASDQVYTSLEIVKPENGASYFEADSVVAVQISPNPALAAGDRVYLYLDGARVGDSDTALGYTLQNVVRGQHTLASAIYDGQGNEKIRSQPVTFYMKQPTINAPAAVGPNVPSKPGGRPTRPTPRGGG